MNILENELIQAAAIPFSLLFKQVIQCRNYLYDRGIIKSSRLGSKVISVGNITVGGTGKTPVVEYIAKTLSGKGERVTILSRGYKRKSKGPIMVSDGKRVLTDVFQAGDEPYLLAHRLKRVRVIVDNNRYRAGGMALSDGGADFLLLDDGFQYRRLQRDVDIVVIDASNPFGNGRVLPAGPLREPLDSLRRAHLIWLTRVDQASAIRKLINRVRKYTKVPIIKSVHAPMRFVNLHTRAQLPLEAGKGKRVIAFAGIGNSKAFGNTLRTLGVEIVDFISYRDHHFYKQNDLATIKTRFEENHAELIVTTEKDALKVSGGNLQLPFYFLQIEIEITEGEQCLRECIDYHSRG